MFQNIFSRFIINKIMHTIWTNQLIAFSFIFKEQLTKKLHCSQLMSIIQSMLITNGIYLKTWSIQQILTSLTWYTYIINTVVVLIEEMLWFQIIDLSSSEKNGGRAYLIDYLKLQSSMVTWSIKQIIQIMFTFREVSIR